MSVIETKTGRKYFRKPESMMLVPYTYDANVGDYVLGRSNVYDISAVIGDSIALEQKDGEVKEKHNEFVHTSIVRNVDAGEYGFTAQCLDLQDKVLRALFGAYTSGNVAALPDNYELSYAMIRIRFKDENLPDIVLPKVQMNSKILVGQMKSRCSQGNIEGTALPRMVAVIDSSSASSSVMRFEPQTMGNSEYAPITPVLFVPRGYVPMVMHHKYGNLGENYIFSTVDFSTGVINNNCSVNTLNGSYEILS